MVSANRQCTRQTEEVVGRSARYSWSWSNWQVRSKFLALIANFLCQTMRWILPFSPFSSPVLEPNLKKKRYILLKMTKIFSTLLREDNFKSMSFNKRHALKWLTKIYLKALTQFLFSFSKFKPLKPR